MIITKVKLLENGCVEKFFIIENVYLVGGLKHSLLSISHLCDGKIRAIF